ncbi:MAG: DUF4350 domain-containing protein [Betaproteobacteria bacterium]|nr:DUF4350 domain-containing protein [Betaproteobacteria bacterium]
MSRQWHIGLAALLAIGLVWYLSGFERVPVTQRVGYSGEARLRPFLAAERFAERMGLAARELRALPELDRLPPGGVLLLPRQRQSIEARRAAQLATWVASGGHLIVEAELAGIADPVLAQLRITRVGGPANPRPLAVQIPESGRKLILSGFSAGRLDTGGQAPRFRVGAPGDERLVTIARGKGLVTATLDLHFARNAEIGRADHAELLWYLLTFQTAQELLVFHHPRRLSLWAFLVEHAPGALLAAAALLALWLWRIAPRYGTVLPDPPSARRRLLDHLRAGGRFTWSRGLRAQMADAAREAALRRVAHAYPDFSTAPPAEQAARLGALAGLSGADAALLLAAPKPAYGAHDLRGAEFMRLVHCAQRVHLALERGTG